METMSNNHLDAMSNKNLDDFHILLKKMILNYIQRLVKCSERLVFNRY